MKLYYPNGELIEDINDFISFYGKAYYYVNRNLSLEDKVVSFLTREGILEEDDYRDILIWKTGRKCSEDGGSITTRRNSVCINIACVSNVCCSIEKENELEFKEAIERLTDVDGVGVAIAITLVHFITKGKYPIYDKFSHIALIKALDDKSAFQDLISDKDLYKEFRTSRKLDYILEDYDKYVGKMKLFEEKCGIHDRRVDRTLWTYGHLFNDIEANRHRYA